MNDARRVDILHEYACLNSLPELELDDITAMAASLCGTPLAALTLIDDRRQILKSSLGIPFSQTPREESICNHTIRQREVFVVPDTTQDDRFKNLPGVAGSRGVRFYAGAPLFSPEDAGLGALCVMDLQPRALSRVQKNSLKLLAQQAMTHLEKRRQRHISKFDENGHLTPGIHDFALNELKALVCTNAHRRKLWLRLVSFRAWPIRTHQFSHAYIGGGFVSTKPDPHDIDVVLQTVEPYGPSSFEALGGFFKAGLQQIFDFYSIHLHFWMEGAPQGMTDFRAFFQYTRVESAPKRSLPFGQGIARINLRDDGMAEQFQRALDPDYFHPSGA